MPKSVGIRLDNNEKVIYNIKAELVRNRILFLTRFLLVGFCGKENIMKRVVALLLTFMLGVMLLFSLASCGECEHTYGEGVLDREATENEVGERHRECMKCGEIVTTTIPRLTHTHTYAEA